MICFIISPLAVSKVVSKVASKVDYLVDAAVVESAGTKDFFEVGYLVSKMAVGMADDWVSDVAGQKAADLAYK